VRVDEREGVEFTEIALVIERSEVTPIDLEAFAGVGLHADEGAWKAQLRTRLVEVFAQNAVTAGIAERPKPLSNDRGAGGRIFLDQLRDRGFVRIQLAGA
jgi:hypothetical protein